MVPDGLRGGRFQPWLEATWFPGIQAVTRIPGLMVAETVTDWT